MADRIVINTGPLVALARAGALDVIGALPLSFVCPSEVRAELDVGAKAGYVTVDVPWLHVVPLAAGIDPVSRAALDPGEAAVIQLATEQAIPIVCLDDRKGRRAALATGLRVTGSLGLLVCAKTLGLLPAISLRGNPQVDGHRDPTRGLVRQRQPGSLGRKAALTGLSSGSIRILRPTISKS